MVLGSVSQLSVTLGHQTPDDGGDSDSDQLLTSTLTIAGLKCMVRARGVTRVVQHRGHWPMRGQMGVTSANERTAE